MDLAIAIRIGSPQSELELVRQTIESIQRNIGRCRYRFILSLDPKIPKEVKEYIAESKDKYPKRFEVFPEQTVYWADFINRAIESAQDCEFFIKAHDDIVLHTVNFFPKLKKILSKVKEKHAWVSFDDIGYLKGYWTPPTRPGFYRDFLYEKAWEKGTLFQFHRLPNRWCRLPFSHQLFYSLQYRFFTRLFPNTDPIPYPVVQMSEGNRELLDIPPRPVKCHAPYNNFVLIKTSVLNKIGPCERWKTYNALLVDEDWGLRALKQKYWNIWIPSIKYEHVRGNVKGGGNRSQEQILIDSKRVHTLFEKKWGWIQIQTDEQLEKIKRIHKNNFIPWSIGRNSYDWDYIK